MSTPASTSSAAIRCVWAAGVLVHEFAGVGDQADVEGRGHLLGDRRPEEDGEVVDDLRRAGGADLDQVEVAEAGVVVVVVDVDDRVAALGEEIDRHAVDVAAVEEDDGAVGHVGRRLVEDLLQRQEAVLDRQRELLGAEEHHRVLAELGQQLVHAQQRAEGVAIGTLVGGQQEAIAGAQLGADPLQVRCGDAGCLTHASSSGSGSCLVEELGDPHALGDRLVVVEGQRRGPLHPRLGGDPRLQDAVGGAQGGEGASRSSSLPSTLTYTFAVRRSGLVSTEVTVTKPMRGSLKSSEIAVPTTSRSTPLMRRMRSPAIPTPVSARPAWSGRTRAHLPP